MNLVELKRLATAATPGDWFAQEGMYADRYGTSNAKTDLCVYSPEDGRYIAAANPQTILNLIGALEQAVEALEQARDDFESEIECVENWFENRSCPVRDEVDSVKGSLMFVNKALAEIKKLVGET